VPSQSACCPAQYSAGLSRLCAVPELSVPFHVDALFVPCHVNGILGVCFGGAFVILAQTLALQAVCRRCFLVVWTLPCCFLVFSCLLDDAPNRAIPCL
jgi:hypothetical protein